MEAVLMATTGGLLCTHAKKGIFENCKRKIEDGSRGALESVAFKYAEELRTHYQDVLDRLEELRKRRVAIDMPSLPVKNDKTYVLVQYLNVQCVFKRKIDDVLKRKCLDVDECLSLPTLDAEIVNLKPPKILTPGKYSPSSCLSDQEEATIYGICQGPPANSSRSLSSRCLSSRSNYIYQSCPINPAEKRENGDIQEQIKKKPGLGKFFRSLGGKKGSPRHDQKFETWKNATSDSHKAQAEVLCRTCELGEEDQFRIMWMVREGFISREHALNMIAQAERSKKKGNKQSDKMGMVLAELGRAVMWSSPGIKKGQPNYKSLFYSDDLPTGYKSLYCDTTGEDASWDQETSLYSDRSSCHSFPPSNRRPTGALGCSAAKAIAKSESPANSSIPDPLPAEKKDVTATTTILSNSKSTSTTCGGDCGNIMCSLSPVCLDYNEEPEENDKETKEKKKDWVRLDNGDGEGGDPSEHEGHRRRTKSEGCCPSSYYIKTNRDAEMEDQTVDYVASSALEGRGKSSVLEKLKHMTKHRESHDICSGSTTTWAGRVRDLHREMKHRIGRLRSTKSSAVSEQLSPDTDNYQDVSDVIDCLENVSKGCDLLSSPQIPISSNCISTTSGPEDASSSPVVPVLLGRARALVDCTPSPYDKDGLAFRKGDIIDILAKSTTGYWVGMVRGQVGHFKFINVQELTSEGKKVRQPIRNNLDQNQATLKSLEELLKHLGLDDYMNVLVLNGYHNLDTLKDLEKDDLVSLGIVNPDHQFRLLSAADQLGEDLSQHSFLQLDNLTPYEDGKESPKLASSRKPYPRDSGCYASNEDLIHKDPRILSSNCSLLSSFGKQNISQSESNILSGDGPNDTIKSANIPDPNSLSTCGINNCSEGITAPSSSPLRDAATRKNHMNIPLSQSSEHLSSSSSPDRTKRGKDNSPSTVPTGIPPVDSNKSHPVRNISDYIESQNIRRHNVDIKHSFPTFAAELEMALANGKYESNFKPKQKIGSSTTDQTAMSTTSCYGSQHQTLGRYCSSNSFRTFHDSYLDRTHHYSEQTAAHAESPLHVSCGSSFVKQMKSATLPPKKKVQTDEAASNKVTDTYASIVDRKTLKKFRHKKRSLHALQPSRPALSLLTMVSKKLEDEQIDLSSEPYTDKTGFCGIPPALVQRYTDELHQDIYDVAEALDQERINRLRIKGRLAVPNDFLADSCNEPVVEANYQNLSLWLTSLGLPIYERTLKKAGFTELYQMTELKDADLRNCGITNPRHIRLLKTAIEALHIHLGHFGDIS